MTPDAAQSSRHKAVISGIGPWLGERTGGSFEAAFVLTSYHDAVPPNAIPGAIALFRQTSAPLIRPWPGSRGMLTMVNRETGLMFPITFWQTEEDSNASAVSDLFMRNPAISRAMPA